MGQAVREVRQALQGTHVTQRQTVYHVAHGEGGGIHDGVGHRGLRLEVEVQSGHGSPRHLN